MQFWHPAGAVFLAVSVGALAVGSLPESFLQPDFGGGFASPPALRVLLAAQAGLLMLICPVVLGRRAAAAGRSAPSGEVALASIFPAAGEYVMLLVASAPLYVVAAWLSDAAAGDVVRGLLYLTGVAMAAWGLSLWVRKGHAATTTAAALAAALIAVGMPLTYYVLTEMTGRGVPPEWLFSAGPATCAYSVAAARGASWHPAPIWAWALWPGVAAALAFARLLRPR